MSDLSAAERIAAEAISVSPSHSSSVDLGRAVVAALSAAGRLAEPVEPMRPPPTDLAWLDPPAPPTDLVFEAHRCQMSGHPNHGSLWRCGCGRVWRFIDLGGPTSAVWRRVGPVGRWWWRKRLSPTPPTPAPPASSP